MGRPEVLQSLEVGEMQKNQQREWEGVDTVREEKFRGNVAPEAKWKE